MFADDGSIPNNPRLPFLVYRRRHRPLRHARSRRVIEKIFASHGWGDMWRNGIFPYVHYHSMIHEALGIARGRAKVRFGGNAGEVLDLAAGDVAVLPAGTGISACGRRRSLCVIGAYPKSGNTIFAGAARPSTPRRSRASPKCRCRTPTPCTGKDGPLTRLWR